MCRGCLVEADLGTCSKKDRLALAITFVDANAVLLGRERRRKDPEVSLLLMSVWPRLMSVGNLMSERTLR